MPDLGGPIPSDTGAPALINPNEAVARLREFVDYEAALPSGPSASNAPNSMGSAGPRTGGLTTVGATGARVGAVNRRTAEREREYWTRLTKVVSDKEWRVWCALEKQLER